MLSPEARKLLKRFLLPIPQGAVLPETLDELYDQWFEGRSFATRFEPGWTFSRRKVERDGVYDLCLEQHTAQFNFGLDPEFRVFVQCKNWIPIASSFVSLVEQAAFVVASGVRKETLRGLGRFPTHEAFVNQHREYLADFQEVKLDPEFTRAFKGPKSIVMAARFYSDEPLFTCYEYFY